MNKLLVTINDIFKLPKFILFVHKSDLNFCYRLKTIMIGSLSENNRFTVRIALFFLNKRIKFLIWKNSDESKN